MSGKALINIKFAADLKDFSTKMANANRKITSMGKNLKKVGAGLSVGVTTPFVAFSAIALKNWDKQEQSIAQVEAGLLSTGNAVGYTSDQLQGMASALQNNSLFGDEEILQKSTAQLLTFTSIAKEQFKGASQASLDLATRLGGDLQGATLMIGKALNSPVENLSALSRAGIQFSEDQKSTIKTLVATNQLAEAQTIILGELESQFGNSAAAAAKAGLGPFKQLQNTIGDVTEEFGAIIAEAIIPFVDKIKGVVSSFQNLSKESKKQIVLFGSIASAVGPVLVGLGFLMTTVVPGLITTFGYLRAALLVAQTGFLKLTAIIAANPFGAIAVAVAAVVSYFAFFNKETDKVISKQALLADVNNTAAKSIANEKAKLAELLFIARDEGIVKSARIKAVKELNGISPKYLGNLTLEKINTDAARKAIELYNNELLKTAKYKAAQTKLQEIAGKIIDLELSKEKESVEFAKRKAAYEDSEVVAAHLKGKFINAINIQQTESNALSEEALTNLKDQEQQLLKIIAANQTLNTVIDAAPKTPPKTSGNKEINVSALNVGKVTGFDSLGIAKSLETEGVRVNGVLDNMQERFSFFQENVGIFTDAVGASFSVLGGQIASIFETGNAVLDAFVGSIINSLASIASAFLEQLIIDRVITAAKRSADIGKASSSGIVIATNAAAAMGLLVFLHYLV